MRVAAAIIGAAGAAIGALRGVIGILGYLFLGTLAGDLFSPVALAQLGGEVAALLFCVLGAVGAYLTITRGGRVGALMMLLAAIGIAASFLAQALLSHLLVPAPVRPEMVEFPPTAFWVISLTPVGALFVGGLFSFLADRRLERAA